MDNLTQKTVKTLLDLGADLVGIAPVERFAHAPDGHRPTDFMPQCKSVISIGLHILQGTADVWGVYEDRCKSITPYLFYGYGLTNIESSRIVNRVAKLLEYQGHKSLCFLPTWLTSMTKYMDESLVEGKLRAEFSHRHAAVAAGIADFGWNGLALTPEFGAMQRFNSILTSAELEPTYLYNGPQLCRKEQCGAICVKTCPTQALSADEKQTVQIGERTFEYAAHDNVRCIYAIHGMVKGSGGRSDIKIPDGPGSFINYAIAQSSGEMHYYDKSMLENCFGIICGDFCGCCLHKCPSRKLAQKDLEHYDFKSRFSVMNNI
ncbi:MAG: hypothetical protein CVU62_07135 [Deltaproteobacteria bacterium HGW-Deltaproteobacteria-2]|jgi:epoxyqueuosine reductase QueG|nr:MAG: hypothetical protein CVU62_07135 [Deltaproteobacteria bacterium HGW-Deltaproteobacteria-2]